MIEVTIRESVIGMGFDVWVYERTGEDEVRVAKTLELDEWADEPAFAEPLPTVRIRRDVLDALVDAASEHRPPSTEQAKHLDDAIEVRDRLLVMIESIAMPPRIRTVDPG
jgi:hypothetical protein